MNPAGTLIAALNPDQDDSYNLIIYDLAAQKTVGTGGGEGFEIYGFHWLNDRRVLFALRKKIISGGPSRGRGGQAAALYPS